jgi:hypothetical protein
MTAGRTLFGICFRIDIVTMNTALTMLMGLTRIILSHVFYELQIGFFVMQNPCYQVCYF